MFILILNLKFIITPIFSIDIISRHFALNTFTSPPVRFHPIRYNHKQQRLVQWPSGISHRERSFYVLSARLLCGPPRSDVLFDAAATAALAIEEPRTSKILWRIVFFVKHLRSANGARHSCEQLRTRSSIKAKCSLSCTTLLATLCTAVGKVTTCSGSAVRCGRCLSKKVWLFGVVLNGNVIVIW